MREPCRIFDVEFERATISKLLARRHDLVLEVSAKVQGKYQLTFESNVNVSTEHVSTTWEPDKRFPEEPTGWIVRGIVVWDSGVVQVLLDDGTIECGPDENYESWNLFTPEKQFICLPGGDLSFFNVTGATGPAS